MAYLRPRRRTPRRRLPIIAGITAALSASFIGVPVLEQVASAQSNLVTNPSFSAGNLTGWTCDAGTASVVTSPVYTGSYALALSPTSADDAQCSQVVAVQPGSSYTLFAEVDGSYLYVGDTGTGTSDTSAWTPGTSGYQQIATTFQTGPSTTSVTVYVHGWYAQPTGYVGLVSLAGPAGGSGTTTVPTTTVPATTTTTSTLPTTTSTAQSTTTGDGGGGNLVSNPTFSTGDLTGWTCDAGTASVVSSPVYTGSYALELAPTSNDDAQCSQVVGVAPGSSYTLSAEVDGSYLYVGESGSGTSGASTWSPGTSGYEQLTTSFTTSASTTQVTVYVHGWYGEPAGYVGEVSLSGPAGSGATTTSAVATTTTTAPVTTTTTPETTTTAITTTTASGSGSGCKLPAHVLEGYWQDFTNGATPLTLAQVPTAYNIVAVAFGTATSTPGQVAFSIDPGLSSALGGYSQQQFIGDISTLHSRCQKVVLSVGGQNGAISVNDSASATEFASSVYSLMQQYGFDGVDIDLENGVNPTYMSQALEQLSKDVGPDLIVTMAPQTVDVQSASSDYLALALDIKNILTLMNTQYYNSGTMNGCDGNVYAESTENFLTALACIQLETSLSPSQIGLGLPATSGAAGSGYVNPSVVNNALDCLASGTNCSSFVPPSKWPSIGGAMTWSINWDASNNYNFADTVAPHLAQLP